MKQLLRYSFLGVMMMLFATKAMAAPFVVLSFPDENKDENGPIGGAYTKTWTAKIGNYEWALTNFNNYNWNNNWTYVRCGRKNNASVANIATAKKMSEAVATIVLDVDKIDQSLLNKVFLSISEDGTNAESIIEMPADKWVKGPMVFTIPVPRADRFYAVYFDNKPAKSNGSVQISRVKYYTQGEYGGAVSIANTPETAYTITRAQQLATAGEGLNDWVYVKGMVSSLENFDFAEHAYNNGEYWISEDNSGTKQLFVYAGRFNKDNPFTEESKPKVGDEVVVYGKLAHKTDRTLLDRGNYIVKINGVEPTGIRNVEVEKKAGNNAPVYNMAGQRVSNAYKGVVIKNGKKLVNK